MSTVLELIQYKEYAERAIQDCIDLHTSKLREMGASRVEVSLTTFDTCALGSSPSTMQAVTVDVLL